MITGLIIGWFSIIIFQPSLGVSIGFYGLIQCCTIEDNLKKVLALMKFMGFITGRFVLLAVTWGRNSFETLFSFGLMSEKLTTGYPKYRSGIPWQRMNQDLQKIVSSIESSIIEKIANFIFHMTSKRIWNVFDKHILWPCFLKITLKLLYFRSNNSQKFT